MLRPILTLWYRMENALSGREKGAVMIEYALVVGIISIVLIVAFVTTDIKTGMTKVAAAVATALNAVVIS